MFGENPEPKTLLNWTHYFIFTITINIVMLNLLISIIGDSYDRI